MKVYVATIRETGYETEEYTLGIYSTFEKARENIINTISKFENDLHHVVEIHEYEVDKEYR